MILYLGPKYLMGGECALLFSPLTSSVLLPQEVRAPPKCIISLEPLLSRVRTLFPLTLWYSLFYKNVPRIFSEDLADLDQIS